MDEPLPLSEFHRPRHISEWCEEDGPALWWTNPITEPPYCGSPLYCGHTVEMRHYIGGEGEIKTVTTNVGGWPGYHEWWTPLPDCKIIAQVLPSPEKKGTEP